MPFSPQMKQTQTKGYARNLRILLLDIVLAKFTNSKTIQSSNSTYNIKPIVRRKSVDLKLFNTIALDTKNDTNLYVIPI